MFQPRKQVLKVANKYKEIMENTVPMRYLQLKTRRLYEVKEISIKMKNTSFFFFSSTNVCFNYVFLELYASNITSYFVRSSIFT